MFAFSVLRCAASLPAAAWLVSLSQALAKLARACRLLGVPLAGLNDPLILDLCDGPGWVDPDDMDLMLTDVTPSTLSYASRSSWACRTCPM